MFYNNQSQKYYRPFSLSFECKLSLQNLHKKTGEEPGINVSEIRNN